MESNKIQFHTNNFQLCDVFIHGLTNSGKSTIERYIKENFHYRPIRNAGTIKQIICEQNNWTMEQLEEYKNSDINVRNKHYEVSDYLGKHNTLNRSKLIATRTSLIFEMFSNPERQICVGDIRDLDEIEIYLSHGFTGIFLTRVLEKNVNDNHWTNQNIFKTERFMQFIKEYPNQIIIIDNPTDPKLTGLDDEYFDALPDTIGVIRMIENCTKEDLEDVADVIIQNINGLQDMQ